MCVDFVLHKCQIQNANENIFLKNYEDTFRYRLKKFKNSNIYVILLIRLFIIQSHKDFYRYINNKNVDRHHRFIQVHAQ